MTSFILLLIPYFFEIKLEITNLVTEFKNCDVQCARKDGKMPLLHQVRIN